MLDIVRRAPEPVGYSRLADIPIQKLNDLSLLANGGSLAGRTSVRRRLGTLQRGPAASRSIGFVLAGSPRLYGRA